MSAQPTYLLVCTGHGEPHYEAYPSFTAAREAAEPWLVAAQSSAQRVQIVTTFDGMIDGVDDL